jgi:hypothetical protein
MTLRAFSGPWRAEANEAGNYVIRDANGFPLAYVYARSQDALRGRYLSPGEAATIAIAIAKFPELLERHEA